MDSMQLIGLNTKWYRYQKGWTQEVFAEKSGFKMAYISTIETGQANLTCKNIDAIADAFKIQQELLFNVKTAKSAQKLPPRVDMYSK